MEFFSNGGSGDSVYLEDTHHYLGVSPQIVRSATLDDVSRLNAFKPPNFIKLDVQGSELDVIHGGQRSFMQSSVVMCELSLIQYNVGAPRLTQVIDALRDCGLAPVGLIDVHYDGRRLIQIDVVFLSHDILHTSGM